MNAVLVAMGAAFRFLCVQNAKVPHRTSAAVQDDGNFPGPARRLNTIANSTHSIERTTKQRPDCCQPVQYMTLVDESLIFGVSIKFESRLVYLM